MHSGTNEPNSNSELTDESSLHTAMFPSHGYSVNHHAMAGFPFPFEPPMNFSYTQLPIPNESWSVVLPAGRDIIIKDFPNSTSFQDIHQGEGVLPLPAAAFDHNTTNYGLPFDAITRWGIGNELVADNPGPCRFTNELSLSLATSGPPCVVVPGISIQEHHHRRSSEMSSSGRSSSSNNSLSVTFNSSKANPVSTLLSGSKFLPAVQEILAEIACCTLENVNQIAYYSGTANAIDHPAENDLVLASTTRFQNTLLQEHEVEAKKKHLMSLLQVVDEQYSQCVDEIHTVVSAFHAVTELDPNLHARFALPTISFMYKKLRERISRHILAIGAQGESGDHNHNPFEASFVQKQWALQQQLRKRDNHLWKPQRGLPERSVSVLRAWMFQNFLHPYPRDAEKHLLAIKSGLTRSQVSNWFINARVRLWKPMIEEMYAEMNRRKVRRNDEENNGCTGVRRNQLSFENIR